MAAHYYLRLLVVVYMRDPAGPVEPPTPAFRVALILPAVGTHTVAARCHPAPQILQHFRCRENWAA